MGREREGNAWGFWTELWEWERQPNRCMGTEEFENPTSAPLIAPVVIITPVPLLYHVCTFYIVR